MTSTKQIFETVNQVKFYISLLDLQWRLVSLLFKMDSYFAGALAWNDSSSKRCGLYYCYLLRLFSLIDSKFLKAWAMSRCQCQVTAQAFKILQVTKSSLTVMSPYWQICFLIFCKKFTLVLKYSKSFLGNMMRKTHNFSNLNESDTRLSIYTG